MKVRFLKSNHYGNPKDVRAPITPKVGDVLELDDAWAEKLIRHGYAEPAETLVEAETALEADQAEGEEAGEEAEGKAEQVIRNFGRRRRRKETTQAVFEE